MNREIMSFSPNRNGLKVLTFNVGALAPFGEITKKEVVLRVEEICRQFESSSYDVILLQEVWTQGYRKRFTRCGFPYMVHGEKLAGLILKKRRGEKLTAGLKWLARFASLFLPKKYGFDKGLVILSRYPLKEVTSFEFEVNGVVERATIDGEFPVNKGALLATIEHPKLGRVRVVNTHLVSQYEDYIYDEQRANQLREVVLRSLEDESLMDGLIVGGDFNMSPPGPEGSERRNRTDFLWRRLRETLLGEFEQADLPYDRLTTYPGRGSSDSINEGVLDHLFSKGKIKPVKGKVVFKEKISCGRELCFPSDHYGLETTYERL